MILSCLHIADTHEMGRGVFTKEDIAAGVIVEESPVIVMTAGEEELLNKTKLYNYIFEWGEKKDLCCLALGYVALYNHSFQSNCEYEMDFAAKKISVKTVREIKAGEELFINYNGDWNNADPLWFDAK